MRGQTAKRMLKLREWSAQVDSCIGSGKPVRQWCEENGMTTKTYYYRLGVVREEMLEALETAGEAGGAEAKPTFVELAAPRAYAAAPAAAAVTVRIGGYAVDVRDGADAETVMRVLVAVARL